MAFQRGGHAMLFHFVESDLRRLIPLLLGGLDLNDLARPHFEDGHRNQLSPFRENLGHSHFISNQPVNHFFIPTLQDRFTDALVYSLISTLTPAERFSFISASTVSGVGSKISIRRLCVRITNCSLDFLSTWGDRRTVYLLIFVGNGIGPATLAPVLFTVSTISPTDWSRTR